MMARPSLVRADTLDLQDPASPHAAEHTKPIDNSNGIAPHQASEYQHVAEERQSEEQALATAWAMSGSEEGEPALQQGVVNGDKSEEDEIIEGNAEDEEQDADDDLMDRISSSPSIDDGKPHQQDNTASVRNMTSLELPIRTSSLPRSNGFVWRVEDMVHNWHNDEHQEREGKYPLDESQDEGYHSPGEDAIMHLGKWTRNPNTRNAFRTPYSNEPRQRLDSNAPLPSADYDLNDLLLPEHDPLLKEIDPWDLGEYHTDQAPPYNDAALVDRHYVDSACGNDSLQETEDIDFEFVYALHTFVATVEGQANATKGDTMVLLDDSNSYWWLVRVVKDSSIGYLPAEHIETPTERLARLNKHRNIDLSQSMLGDNPEKSRNPLKMAMRRRNGKTVQFAAPTYVEASDYEYSDDENEPADVFATPLEEPANGQLAEVEERNAPEEANVHATRRHSGDQSSIASKNSFDSSHKASFDGGIGDDPQLSPKLVDRSEAAPLKSRKGTPRNTDSFLKDDSIETRKITLTPGILREDGNTSKSSSIDSQRNPSMESLTKVVSPSESASSASSKKDGRDKKKDKQKGGMLSGLFKSKKKDKKGGKDDESEERASMDLARGSSPANGSTSPIDKSSSAVAVAAAAGRDVQVQSREPPKPVDTPLVAELQGSEVSYEMVGTIPEVSRPTVDTKAAVKASNPFRDPEREAEASTPSGTITDGADFVHIPPAFSGSNEEIAEIKDDKRPSVSRLTTTDDDSELFTDARENTISPTSQSADTIVPPTRAAPAEPPARGGSTSSHSSSGAEAETPKSASVVSHDSKQTWDDGALRAWLDAEEVKDMLTIVHSSAHADGQIEPVGDDHPLMRGLYAEERGAVGRMMTELDALLMGFATRKGLV